MLTRASAPVPSEPIRTTSLVGIIDFDFNAGLLSQTGHSDRLIKRADLVGELTRLKEIVEEQTAKNSELARKNEEQATKNEVLTKTVEGQAAKNEELTKTIAELTKITEDQATKNSELAKKNEEQATKNEVLTKTVEGQATKNEVLTKKVEAQAARNSKLTKTSEVQATKISELAKKNEEQATQNEALTRTIEGQATQISNLSQEVAECKQEIKRITEPVVLGGVIKMLETKCDLGLNRKKADFEYELDSAFLQSNERHCSRYFLAGGLAWRLEFHTKEREERFLSIYLRASSYAGGSGKWSINATQNLTVLNQSGGLNRSFECTRDFTIAGDFVTTNSAWGFSEFISANLLRTCGYIKNNKIKVHVSVQLGELIRSA